MSTISVKGFAGGITDFPVSADINKYETADNFVINEYEDLQTRPGTLLDFTTTGVRARLSTNLRVGLMAPQTTGADANFTVLKQSSTKLFYDNGTTRTELVGPGSASAFNITDMDEEVACSYSDWNNHTFIAHETPFQIPVKVYRESSGTLTLRTAGLPRIATGFTATGGAGANYIYALVYKYTYNVGSTAYIDRGRPYLSSFTGIGTATPSSNPGITVGSIPVLANATGEHYDTTAIKVEVYRTTNGGSVLYYVGEVTNGTTSYADTTSDNTLVTAGVTLYTTGGVLENDRPPKAAYVHSTSDFTFYANGKEVSVSSADGEYIPQRVWQSKRGDPDSVPASFYTDIEEPITGISSIKSIPIIFGKNSVYRLDGTFDNSGRGGLFPRKISDKVGCVGHLSIVQTMNGLYFAGNDGFYFTDGYNVQSLSAEDFKETYAGLVSTALQRKRIYGVYDGINKRILWATNNPGGDTGTENNKIFCLYLPVNKFTTWTSGYVGDGPFLSQNVSVSGTTVTVGSTASMLAGDFVRSPAHTFDAYIVSVDSATTFTTNVSIGAGTVMASFFHEARLGIDYYGNFQPSALLNANDTIWQGDGRGFTLKYDNDTLYDVQLDSSVDSAAGATEVDPYKLSILNVYSGPAMDFGTTEFIKWVNSVLIKLRPRGDVSSIASLIPYSENNINNSLSEMREVVSQAFYYWGTPLVSYGDPRLWRRRQQIVDEMRRFPKNSLRCEYKQLHLKTGVINIYNSNSYLAGTISSGSAGTKVMTVSNALPDDLHAYFVSFSTDSYTAEYKILSSTSSTFTFLDTGNDVATGAAGDWVIRGFPINNYINLVEYSMFFEILGSTQSSFQSVSGAV
jgi:hypothetical protein